MRDLTPSERLFAAQAAERHRIPKATATHPAVIVPGDEFMTEKLREPDYVPYCGPCMPMQRVRRTAYGFQCPICGTKMNYNLTHYDGNKGVIYTNGTTVAAEYRSLSITEWNAQVEARKAARRARKDGKAKGVTDARR
jgi:predicted RNA-binding Zn-ribbon protein involved in translation (DUF1610 family)